MSTSLRPKSTTILKPRITAEAIVILAFVGAAFAAEVPVASADVYQYEIGKVLVRTDLTGPYLLQAIGISATIHVSPETVSSED